MKKIIFGIVVMSLLLVGCGKTAELTPATKPLWVASYMVSKPTVYYVSTGEKVQAVGKLIIELKPNAPDTLGPGGWASPYVTKYPIEVNAIPGVDETKAVAIKYSNDSSYIKAIAQNKQP